jgi:hypothetical protein
MNSNPTGVTLPTVMQALGVTKSKAVGAYSAKMNDLNFDPRRVLKERSQFSG